jgi:hypothetical protein
MLKDLDLRMSKKDAETLTYRNIFLDKGVLRKSPQTS